MACAVCMLCAVHTVCCVFCACGVYLYVWFLFCLIFRVFGSLLGAASFSQWLNLSCLTVGSYFDFLTLCWFRWLCHALVLAFLMHSVLSLPGLYLKQQQDKQLRSSARRKHSGVVASPQVPSCVLAKDTRFSIRSQRTAVRSTVTAAV